MISFSSDLSLFSDNYDYQQVNNITYKYNTVLMAKLKEETNVSSDKDPRRDKTLKSVYV